MYYEEWTKKMLLRVLRSHDVVVGNRGSCPLNAVRFTCEQRAEIELACTQNRPGSSGVVAWLPGTTG